MAVNEATLWSSIVLVLVFTQAAEALVSEAKALLKFQSQVIDRQGSLYNWGNSTDDPCGDTVPWVGVTCMDDASGGQTVIEINLSYQSLGGTIAEGWDGLDNLETLDLTGNSFSGRIPLSLQNLPSLGELRLGGNRLVGTIPPLPDVLQRLTLENNLLTGDITETKVFDHLLDTLNLQGNHFTGNLPDIVSNTTLGGEINVLDLSNNRLGGRLPSDLGGFGIEYLDLSQNSFQGEIPDNSWGQHVNYVDLSGNNLTGTVPPFVFSNWTAGSYLNLSNNLLTGRVDLTRGEGSFVRFLDLSFNQFEGELEIGKALANNAEILLLQNNRFSGSLNGLFQHKFPNLRELAAGNNEFDGSGLPNSATDNFPLLGIMDLRGSRLTGKFPSELFVNETFHSLQVLDLSNNSLNGTLPESLLQLPLLEELRLQANSLRGALSIRLAEDQTNLRILDLSHNSFAFNGSDMQGMLGKFPNLRELRLASSNTETIAFPDLPRELQLLEILDLSSCNLNGSIPDGYGTSILLPSLSILNLSNNSLRGSLPRGIGKLPGLSELNVSNNKLSGEVPTFSYRLFNSSAFAGNDGLCGLPLPPCSHPQSRSLKVWQIVTIVAVCVTVSGGGCLSFGLIWRRNVDAKRRKQDALLIAALLERDTTTIMSLRELKKATNDFSEANKIGSGGFGTVYRGTLQDGTEVAIKRSKRDATSSEEKHQFLNEVKILSQVHHRNLVRLLGCCLAQKEALLVFEFVKNGTLDEHLHPHKDLEGGASPLSWQKRLEIAVQTASALDYLHSSANPPIYHLDVKSANILLDENMNAKVADFGISKLAPALDVTHITANDGIRGTMGYMDPESVVSSMWTGKSDVFAYGVVLLELITSKSAVDFSRGENASLVQWAVPLIQKGCLEEIIDPSLLEELHRSRVSMEEVARLATKCLRFQSVLRPSMKEVLTDLLTVPHVQSMRRLSAKETLEYQVPVTYGVYS